jgi:hypothetical protein
VKLCGAGLKWLTVKDPGAVFYEKSNEFLGSIKEGLSLLVE